MSKKERKEGRLKQFGRELALARKDPSGTYASA